MKRLFWLLALLPALALGQQAAGPFGIFGGPISSTTLPPASTIPINTYAFTTDQGLLIDNGSAWVSAVSSASVSFGSITGGDNTTAAMTVDTGSTLAPTGSGQITATTASAAAALGTECAAGQAARGVDTNWNAKDCFTPSGSGTVGTTGSPASGQLSTFSAATTITGTAVGSNTIVGNSGSGIAALSPASAIGVLNSQTSNGQVGTSYTFVSGDANNEVTMNNAAANTVCIPPNSSVNFAAGTLLTVQELGAGVTTIAPAGTSGCAGSGVTIQSPQQGSSTSATYSLGGAYGFIQLQQTQTNTWNVVGWTQPMLPIAYGGTGIGTAPTDGQLLIGNSSTSKYAVSALTAGPGITVTNGHGTITIASTASGGPQDEMPFLISSVSQAATDYACPQGANAGLQVASTVPCIVANASGGTFKNLFFQTTNAPASGQTFTVTLYTGTPGSSLTSTTLTCQVSNPNKSCSDVSHTVTVSQGQGWLIQIVTSSTSGATGIGSFGLEFDP